VPPRSPCHVGAACPPERRRGAARGRLGGLRAGWRAPAPDAFALAYSERRARGFEPLPSFGACLRGSRAGCGLPTPARRCRGFSGRAGPSPACPSLTGRVRSWKPCPAAGAPVLPPAWVPAARPLASASGAGSIRARRWYGWHPGGGGEGNRRVRVCPWTGSEPSGAGCLAAMRRSRGIKGSSWGVNTCVHTCVRACVLEVKRQPDPSPVLPGVSPGPGHAGLTMSPSPPGGSRSPSRALGWLVPAAGMAPLPREHPKVLLGGSPSTGGSQGWGRGNCRGAGATGRIGPTWPDTAPASLGSGISRLLKRPERAGSWAGGSVPSIACRAGGAQPRAPQGDPRHGTSPPPAPGLPMGAVGLPADLAGVARPEGGAASPESPSRAGVQAPLPCLQAWLLFS